MLIVFVDPPIAAPHDVNGRALMRLATVYDIPMALNRSTAGIAPGWASSVGARTPEGGG